MANSFSPAKSRGLLPDYCFSHVTAIAPDWLAARDIRGLLIDVDNTICRWEHLDVPVEAAAWLKSVAEAGIQCRLLSNGLAHKRAAVAKSTGIAQVGGPLFKPVPAFYRLGLKQMNLKCSEVMMIGDSVFTDIAGANRCGIWTALVEPLGNVDFAGSKLYRAFESLLKLRRPLNLEGDYRHC